MSDTAPTFTIIGLPNQADFEPGEAVRRVLEAHTVFVGGERHRTIIARWLPAGHRWIDFRSVRALLEEAAMSAAPLVVFASGDPLFYGIAGALRSALPAARVHVLPWFNSVQLLCHRLALPYAELAATSLHGRDWHELDAALLRGERLVGVLTDAGHTPADLARRLLDYGFTQYTLNVGESLESPSERVRTLSLQEAADTQFDPLNCLVLEAPHRCPPALGLDESAFAGLPGRPDMVTKMPVRLASLARLDLARRRCLWDVGFCTGSVAIEARRANPHLRVVAFEKRPECAALLDRNARAFGAPGIVPVIGDFFEQPLAALPAPDAVFIGGHGGRLGELIDRIDAVLAPGGRVVINAVLDSSRHAFESAIARLGYRSLPALRLQVDAHNPIAVLAAEKPSVPIQEKRP
ncbi:MAG TPA: precorrin-6y C5,15-methyltransferase (decarboxylating) subunit CbiE [Opitutaceae bacterium]|nr:precorrin-6y C5,15-methyltransferase (decarboxylating) subunit CbiE [Opitutaceae bacterium]